MIYVQWLITPLRKPGKDVTKKSALHSIKGIKHIWQISANFTRKTTFVTSFWDRSFSNDRSNAVPLLQFLFVRASVVSFVTFVLTLFVPHLSFVIVTFPGIFTYSFPVCFITHKPPSEKRFILKGKDLLSRGANSFLLEYTPVQTIHKQFWQSCFPWKYLFPFI